MSNTYKSKGRSFIKTISNPNHYHNEKNILLLLNKIPLEISRIKCFDDKEMTLELDNFDGLDLYYWIQYYSLQKNHITSIFKNILKTLICISKFKYTFNGKTYNGIYHCDLKPENICFHLGKPFIIDWGLSYSIPQDIKNTFYIRSGTLLYTSPQKLLSTSYDYQKNDVWSLGVILFTLIFKIYPYDVNVNKNISPKNYYFNPIFSFIKAKKWTDYWDLIKRDLEIISLRSQYPNTSIKVLANYSVNLRKFYPHFYDSDLRELIQNMLSYDESNRYSFEQVYNHPWFNDSCQIDELQRIQDICKNIKLSNEHILPTKKN